MRLSGESATLEFDTNSVTVASGESYAIYISQELNLRTCLGDMYDRYNQFMIVFNGIGGYTSTNINYNAGSVTLTGNTAVWTIAMTGLPFNNTTFNGVPLNIAYFPTRFTMPTNAYAVTNNASPNGICFRKPPSPNANIAIFPVLTRSGGAGTVFGSGAAGTTGTYDFNFSFTVYGLSE